MWHFVSNLPYKNRKWFITHKFRTEKRQQVNPKLKSRRTRRLIHNVYHSLVSLWPVSWLLFSPLTFNKRSSYYRPLLQNDAPSERPILKKIKRRSFSLTTKDSKQETMRLFPLWNRKGYSRKIRIATAKEIIGWRYLQRLYQGSKIVHLTPKMDRFSNLKIIVQNTSINPVVWP